LLPKESSFSKDVFLVVTWVWFLVSNLVIYGGAAISFSSSNFFIWSTPLARRFFGLLMRSFSGSLPRWAGVALLLPDLVPVGTTADFFTLAGENLSLTDSF
jgi:hypothetical protein